MSDCSCIYVGASDLPVFLRDKEVKARVEHRCSECDRKILKGEQYEYVAGSWEGDFSVYKTCGDCLSIRNELFCECWSYGEVWYDVGQHIKRVGEDILSCDMRVLTKAARDRLLDMVEEDWDE